MKMRVAKVVWASKAPKDLLKVNRIELFFLISHLVVNLSSPSNVHIISNDRYAMGWNGLKSNRQLTSYVEDLQKYADSIDCEDSAVFTALSTARNFLRDNRPRQKQETIAAYFHEKE